DGSLGAGGDPGGTAVGVAAPGGVGPRPGTAGAKEGAQAAPDAGKGKPEVAGRAGWHRGGAAAGAAGAGGGGPGSGCLCLSGGTAAPEHGSVGARLPAPAGGRGAAGRGGCGRTRQSAGGGQER